MNLKYLFLLVITIIIFLPLSAFADELLQPPVITSLSPDKARVGESLIIRGTGFRNEIGKVFFDDIEATVVFWSDVQIIAAVPLGASSGKVKVVTALGESDHLFKIKASWNMYSSPTRAFLNGIGFYSPKNGWLMEKTNQGEIFRFDGKSWEGKGKIDGGWISDICFVDSNYGWAVGGGGTILYFNGKNWERTARSVTGDDLNDVFFINPKNGWAVGGEGRIIHYYDWTVQDISWKKESSVPVFDTLNAVWFISPDKGWVMGRDGVILEYNKGKWVQITSPTGSIIYSISFASKNNGWAVGGGGTILQYNGRAWVSVASPVTKNLYSVYMVSDNDGWIVGEEGIILHYNGSFWEKVDSPTNKSLNKVYFISPENGWAVGEEGIIIWYH